MVELRKLRVHPLTDGVGRKSSDPTIVPPNRIVSGQVCEGCRWPDRCKRDAICWAAEKAAIASEKEAVKDRVDWTEERIVQAIHDWVTKTGRIPAADDWERETDAHPSLRQVIQVFGKAQGRHRRIGWTHALAAAGYKPLLPWGKDPNTYPPAA